MGVLKNAPIPNTAVFPLPCGIIFWQTFAISIPTATATLNFVPHSWCNSWDLCTACKSDAYEQLSEQPFISSGW